MPLLLDLSHSVEGDVGRDARPEWPLDLWKNVELLLTHLAADHPWKSPAERHLDLSDYHRIASSMLHHIEQAEVSVLGTSQGPPDWLRWLVDLWHRRRSIVVTFNYDTLVERAASAMSGPGLSHLNLYNVPIGRAEARYGGGVYGIPEVPTFTLLKMHGSRHWWYGGPGSPPGDPVYVTGYSDKWLLYPDRNDAGLIADKTQLVVPPTLQKEPFYSSGVLRAQWSEASRWIKSADRIVLLGYSLPESDLTSRMLMMLAPDDVEVEVVDYRPAAGAEIQSRLPAARVHQRFDGEDALPNFAYAEASDSSDGQ